jgi:hypothetical protein
VARSTQTHDDVDRRQSAANKHDLRIRRNAAESALIPWIRNDKAARNPLVDMTPRRTRLRQSWREHNTSRQHRSARRQQQLVFPPKWLDVHDGIAHKRSTGLRLGKHRLHALHQVAPEKRTRSKVVRAESPWKLLLKPLKEARRPFRKGTHARSRHIEQVLIVTCSIRDAWRLTRHALEDNKLTLWCLLRETRERHEAAKAAADDGDITFSRCFGDKVLRCWHAFTPVFGD